MARTFYGDGSLGSGGDGSIGNPFGKWSDIVNAVGDCAGQGVTTIYIKGTFTVGNHTSHLRFNFTSGDGGAGAFGTDVSNYIVLLPWPGFEGNGQFGSAPGFAATAATGTTLFTLDLPYSQMLGIDVYATGSDATARNGVLFNSVFCKFSGYIRCNSIAVSFGADDCVLFNTIAKVTRSDAAASRIPTSIDRIKIYNFTCVSTGASTAAAHSVAGATGDGICQNCAVYGFTGLEWEETGGTPGTWNGSTNCAGQIAVGSQNAHLTTNYVQLTADPFVNLAGDNYFPAASGQLDGVGTTTYTATDLVGATWGSPAAIGGLEVALSVAVLSAPAGTPDTLVGSSGNTADLSVNSDTGSGTLYWFLSTSATPPTVANLKTGTGSVAFDNQAVSGAGAQTMNNKGSLAEKTTYYAHFVQNTTNGDSAIVTSAGIVFGTDAPTLSAPSGTQTGTTTADLSVATTRLTGTLWGVVTTSNTQPSTTQIKAGQDHTGAAAQFAANDATVSNPQLFSATGLPSGTVLYAHFYQEDAESDPSNRVTSASFSTVPVLTSPSGTPDATTGPTGNTASLSVSTVGVGGTLYWFISTSASPPTAANLKTGVGATSFGSQAVAASGSQSIPNVGSLAEKVTYYAHFLRNNGTDSAIVSSSGIVIPTDAPVLSAAVGTAGDATAALSVATTRVGVGTLWVVVTTAVTQPSTTQIKAGQNHLGAAAAYASSDASVSNPQLFSAVGLVNGTGYYAHFYQEDVASDPSNRITSNSFTPTGAGIYNVDSFSPPVIRPGDTVTVGISGAWNAGGKTATLNGHPVTLTSQSAIQVQFTAPALHTDPTYNDTRYAVAMQFVLTDGGFQGVKNYIEQPPSGYDFLDIVSIGGIWVNDVGVAIGDDHLGHFTAGSGDPISDDGILSHIVGFPAIYEYWRFDESEATWTAAATETFYETVAFVGPNYAAVTYYEGIATAGFDATAGFNVATANISAYAETGAAVPGLTLDPPTGQLTGTPTVQGAYNYTVRAMDSDSNTAFSNTWVITVHETPVWTGAPANQTWVDGQNISLNLAALINANGFGPAASFAQTAGALPSTVTLDVGTGLISGTLDADASQSSPYNGQDFTATNPAGVGAMPGSFNIVVNPHVPLFFGPIANFAVNGSGAMAPLDVSGEFATYIDTYAFVGAVPTGITIDNSGVITGTPSTFGVYANIKVRATNVTGSIDSNAFTITSTAEGATFTGSIANIGPLGLNVAMAPVDVSGEFGGGPATGYEWVGNPPTGVVISAVGVISGTPTVAGSFNGRKIRKLNSGGNAESNAFNITVTGGLPVQLAPIPNRSTLNGTDVGSIDFTAYFSGAVSVAVTVLPTGLIDTAGVVTGVLTTVQVKSVVVTASNVNGDTVVGFTWTVLTLIPTLSNIVEYPRGTTALVRITSDRNGGTLYWVITGSATVPSIAQIKLGQDHTGAAAVDAGTIAVAYIGEQSIAATGLSVSTSYWVHAVHNVVAGDSLRDSSAEWQTRSTDASGASSWFQFF